MQARPVIADFFAGNPQEPTLPGLVAALQRWSVPRSIDWFAYGPVHQPAREAAAASLSAELGVRFAAKDLFLTRGAGGAIQLALATVVDPGDEVIFLSPPWFFYEAMIVASGATPVRARLAPPAFDLDVEAIVGALTPRTRAIIINTPHNPTGRIYPATALQRLADALAEAGRQYGRPIWIISDEAYSRIPRGRAQGVADLQCRAGTGRGHAIRAARHRRSAHRHRRDRTPPGSHGGRVAEAGVCGGQSRRDLLPATTGSHT